MCLNYGTPYRFSRTHTEGIEYPLECHDKTTLKDILQEECAAGVYDTPAYHPLLAAMLRGLAENDTALPSALQEPEYPFCDLVQAVSLLFGFANSARFVPDIRTQTCNLLMGNQGVQPHTYAIGGYILTNCCPEAVRREWYESYAAPKYFFQGGQFRVTLRRVLIGFSSLETLMGA